jgi:hypothetical protein
MFRKILIIFVLAGIYYSGTAQNSTVRIALGKYSGGGDWYANPTSLPNLIRYCNQNLATSINPEPATVELSSSDIFSYPFVHITGHGNIVFSGRDIDNIRNYLLAGGFLHVDDNYGIDEHIRREIKRVFPDKDLMEIPFSHPIFHQKFEFPDGLPKIHEHDKKPPQAFGIFQEGRLIFLYTFESDLGDGWEDQAVHNDSEEARTKALKMGANIISYVFSN